MCVKYLFCAIFIYSIISCSIPKREIHLKNLSTRKDSLEINLKVNDELIFHGYVRSNETAEDYRKFEYLEQSDVIKVVVHLPEFNCIRKVNLKEQKESHFIIVKIEDIADSLSCDSINVKIGWVR
jgi:hypothetical protein